MDEPLSILTGLGLLEMEDPTAGPTIRPLLAGYVRTLPGAGEALFALTGALGSLTYGANETGLADPFLPLRPHVESAIPVAEAAGLQCTAILWNELGRHLQLVGDYAGARAALERALAFDEEIVGPNSISVAVWAGNLGKLLVEMGDLAGARTALERALAIRGAALGPDYPKTQSVRRNLAVLDSVQLE